MQTPTSGQFPSGTTSTSPQSTPVQAGSIIPPEPASQLDLEGLKLIKWITGGGIAGIVLILIAVLILASSGHLGIDIASIVALLTSGIGVIGTIIGSVVGHAQGATGRESEAKVRGGG